MSEDELEPTTIAPVEPNPTKAKTEKLRATALNDKNAMSITAEILKREKTVMLKLASTERDKHAQFVGINGKTWMIPRDVWVKVPESVVATLEESKITNYSVMSDPNKSDAARVDASETSRFSFQSKPVADNPEEAKVK